MSKGYGFCSLFTGFTWLERNHNLHKYLLRMCEHECWGQEFCKNCSSDHLGAALGWLSPFQGTLLGTCKVLLLLSKVFSRNGCYGQVKKPFLFHYTHDAKVSRVQMQKYLPEMEEQRPGIMRALYFNAQEQSLCLWQQNRILLQWIIPASPKHLVIFSHLDPFFLFFIFGFAHLGTGEGEASAGRENQWEGFDGLGLSQEDIVQAVPHWPPSAWSLQQKRKASHERSNSIFSWLAQVFLPKATSSSRP